MPSLTRSELAAYAVCVVLVAVLGWRALRSGGEPAPSQAAVPSRGSPAVSRTSGGTSSIVHVVGAVRRPGVYRLRAGARVQEAIAKAGGASAAADLQGVNLAAKISDAQQVVVPRRAPRASGTAIGVAEATGASPGSAAPPSGPVNLNTATAEQLDALDGVGPATVQKILELRVKKGGFGSVDDLGEVPGIGPKRLATLREQVGV
jgi:competence protein ComEA